MNTLNVELSVSEFVAVLNQTLEYAYSSLVIHGELANFRVTKNNFVYFDLKDETAKVSFFGSVYKLPGPLENGMLLRVKGVPRLHPQYGFSVNFSLITPTGSGSIDRLKQLLKAKLEAEGLFAIDRKRALPYPPARIGLITSMQSAAFADFTKIINARWGGLEINCIDVNVQGDQAPAQIIKAIEYFSALAKMPDVLVIIRGGGSREDLSAFSNEQVTRAVAASRIPTMVAIGHETDLSLAELVADYRASTPSNAAELLVPDKTAILAQLQLIPDQIKALIIKRLKLSSESLVEARQIMPALVSEKLLRERLSLDNYLSLLEALSPKDILRRGYAIVRLGNKLTDGSNIRSGNMIQVEMAKVDFKASVGQIRKVVNGK